MGTPTAEFENVVNDCYHALMRAEATLLRKSSEREKITSSEMNIIGAVGDSDSPTISEISEFLGITVPSVTDGVNRLVKRDILTKTRDEKDARVVRVGLTRNGRRMYTYKKFYLRATVRAIVEDFSDDELVLLRRAVLKVNDVIRNIPE